jgi:hypothetical protein
VSRAARAIESLRGPFLFAIISGEMLKFLCLHLVHSVIVSRATDLSLMLRSHMSGSLPSGYKNQVAQTRFSSLISRIAHNVSILVVSLAAFKLHDGQLAFKGIDVR